MDAFSYLSVLLSIILGLAITQVLQGVRGLLLARGRVRLYAPSLIWCALILTFATQSWWASFGLAEVRDWTFAGFGALLLQTTLLYMLAALVLPDFPAGEPVDLEAHYFREARPFYIVTVAMLASSLLKDKAIGGEFPTGENLAFHFVFAAFSAVMAVSRSSRLHLALSILIALLVATYIALLFSVLAR
jgi:hypothetical protein